MKTQPSMKHPNAVGRFTLALLLVVTLILGGCGQNSELPLEIYWIDVEEQGKTKQAQNRDEAYPEVDLVYDQYRIK